MRKIARLQKRKRIGRDQGATKRKTGDADEYDLSWWRPCKDIEWLISRGVEGSEIESEWWQLRKDSAKIKRVGMRAWSFFKTK